MNTLKTITPGQILDYSPSTTAEQAVRLAVQYNYQWAGRTWQIVDGALVYGGRP